LGHIAAVLEHDTEAQQYYRQALEIVAKTGAVPVTLDIFCGWALLLSRRELLDTEHKQVIELLTLVQHHPAATHETQKKAAERLLELAAEMPAEVVKVVKTRRQTSDWQALTQLGHALLTLGSALG
jgi:hypothetical protein